MKYRVKVYSIYEYGKRVDSEGNPHQEDWLYPMCGEYSDEDRTFILCDGMGGHDAGEVASETVCEAMSNAILNDGHDKDGIFTAQDLQKAVADAFDALDAKDTGSEKKMGTTMTLLKLHNGGATIAHMGDSRVYHIRPGKSEHDTTILFQTEDHSLVNELVKMGEMTHDEARHSKNKNVITRAMQPNMEKRPTAEVYNTSDIKSGDYFYMCSDGMLEQDEMEDGSVLKRIFSNQVKSDEQRVSILRGATNENHDNHTAFIIHVLKVFDTPKEKRFALMRPHFAKSMHWSWRVFIKMVVLLVVVILAIIGINSVATALKTHSKEVSKTEYRKSQHHKRSHKTEFSALNLNINRNNELK